jgi:hypothetical protein
MTATCWRVNRPRWKWTPKEDFGGAAVVYVIIEHEQAPCTDDAPQNHGLLRATVFMAVTSVDPKKKPKIDALARQWFVNKALKEFDDAKKKVNCPTPCNPPQWGEAHLPTGDQLAEEYDAATNTMWYIAVVQQPYHCHKTHWTERQSGNGGTHRGPWSPTGPTRTLAPRHPWWWPLGQPDDWLRRGRTHRSSVAEIAGSRVTALIESGSTLAREIARTPYLNSTQVERAMLFEGWHHSDLYSSRRLPL